MLLSTIWVIIDFFTYTILGYFVILNTVYLVLLFSSYFTIRNLNRSRDAFEVTGLFESDLHKSVSILLPVYNEEETVRFTVYSLLQLDFHNFEIIVINDGSTDSTFELLKEEFELFPTERFIPQRLNSKPVRGVYASRKFPDLIVLDKENGKKADALNAGTNAARKDLVCSVDADSWLERNILRKMLRAFVEDETTVAVGGVVRVANGCVFEKGQITEVKPPKSFLAKIQIVEYMRAFLFGRMGWASIDGLLIISGAFAVFDREAVIEVGGYKVDSIGEDVEIVVYMHKHFRDKNQPYSIKYLPEPVCWTRVPETWNELSAQRNRWQRGLADTLFNQKEMIGNRKYGKLGTLSLPFHFIFELIGPVFEFAGYLIFFLLMIAGFLKPEFAIMFIIFALLFGMILSIGSVLLDELTYRPYSRIRDVLSLTLHAIIENLGFRQLHFWWRLRGLYDYLSDNKEWNIISPKPKLVNAIHWFFFAAINCFFVGLLYYGLFA